MKLSSNLYSNKKWMHFLLELLALATQNELTHDLRKRWISVSDTLLLAHHQHQNHWTWKRKQQIQSKPSRYFIQVLILIVSSWTRGFSPAGSWNCLSNHTGNFWLFSYHQPRSQKSTNPVGTAKFIIPYQKQIPSTINNERAIKSSVYTKSKKVKECASDRIFTLHPTVK